jgi:hypothetical protein
MTERLYPSREKYLEAQLMNEKEKNNRLRDRVQELEEELRSLGRRRDRATQH